MTRIAQRLSSLRANQRKALVAYITAGDPNPSATVPAMHALVAGGADILELGIPFTDPEADGPAIQAGAERALAAGTRLANVFEMVAEFRSRDADTPVLLMGYLNSIERTGCDEFASRSARAGVDGTIIVNLPPEESASVKAAYAKHGLDSVFLIAPTSTPERIERITGASSGFVYYVSLKGVTGANNLAVAQTHERVAQIKAVTKLPVMVGFGIKDGSTAARIAPCCDGVVVGSAFVNTMGRLADQPSRIPEALTAQARALREAVDSA